MGLSHTPRAAGRRRAASRPAGFTLIELLVVIGILVLLSGALLSGIGRGTQSAERFADRTNLLWHYAEISSYYFERGHRLPAGTGHRFVLEPWVSRSVPRTPENFARYWTPGLPSLRREELERSDLSKVWNDRDALTSDDTHYAGPSAALKRERLFNNGELPLMANDNEYGPAFSDHTIHVLMGGGAVRSLLLDPTLLEQGFDPDREGAVFLVGPESPHPLLRLLDH